MTAALFEAARGWRILVDPLADPEWAVHSAAYRHQALVVRQYQCPEPREEEVFPLDRGLHMKKMFPYYFPRVNMLVAA
jgi:hypothetical protein